MIKNTIKKRMESELSKVIEQSSICISVKGFFMEAGFKSDCTAQEKHKFYAGTTEFVSCIKTIAEILNENTVYIGSCIKNEKNYYNWKDIKNYDAYNALRDKLKPEEIKAISLSTDNMLDLIIECNLRYLSQIMIYFPVSNIFIRPDVHCYLEIYGTSHILNTLFEFFITKTDTYIVWKNDPEILSD